MAKKAAAKPTAASPRLKEEQRTIILLTVKELLDGNFAHKLV